MPVFTTYYGSKQPPKSARVKTFIPNSNYNVKIYNSSSSGTYKQPNNTSYLKAVNINLIVSIYNCSSPCLIDPCAGPPSPYNNPCNSPC
uniref:Uncharacterized protein n=1 Tax=viral metagenome TaxID=1070528 RepID=A0A6C0HVS9_9ZZZZ